MFNNYKWVIFHSYTWEGRNESRQLASSHARKRTPAERRYIFHTRETWQTPPSNPPNPAHTDNMATTSSKTVQTPKARHMIGKLIQTSHKTSSAAPCTANCLRFNLPLRRNVNPPWAVFGSGLEGVAQLALLVLEEDISSEREVE